MKSLNRNHSHIEFVRNSCLIPTGFEPVNFFAHFQFKASARVFATQVLKDTIEFLKNENDEEIKDWAVQFSKYDYQVTLTFFLFISIYIYIYICGIILIFVTLYRL